MPELEIISLIAEQDCTVGCGWDLDIMRSWGV